MTSWRAHPGPGKMEILMGAPPLAVGCRLFHSAGLCGAGLRHRHPSRAVLVSKPGIDRFLPDLLCMPDRLAIRHPWMYLGHMLPGCDADSKCRCWLGRESWVGPSVASIFVRTKETLL
ncbi:hypothetical protein P170DRAFT_48091 [Aspergillus steynii IBT 23096]|uniref:Uncharacterized protein n=1 Tax=Aspergillus steynii IBT 23096 TaxID=1392250 RepID=A0A2I2GS46_9EURO|nr:uncharacterized protein P170DRAFT_48091 [Aspergillus steynii IBT 23096]PLB55701.1 hypothetical protein P170DRAFT_48091 [Aspergillus steynii IBT 23096]